MFDFSSGELLLIALAVLIFIKPKDLPVVLRTVGQWTSKIRRMAGEFQDQFREAMREAEMADIKKDIEEATGKIGAGIDPFKELHEAAEWKPPETTSTIPPAADAPPAPPAEAVAPEPAPVAAAEAASTPALAPAAEPAAASVAASEPAAASEPVAAPPTAGGDRAA
jgi:sec-independent protein translocase protein TatB